MAYSGAYGADKSDDENMAEERRQAAPHEPPTERRRRPELGGLLKRIEAAGMETDDLLMALVLFLMYRESGDTDLLILLGVMLLT